MRATFYALEATMRATFYALEAAMRATFYALEPEGNRFRFPSVRPHGGLLQWSG